MSDRGMAKWAPYKSLIEQEDYLGKVMKDKHRVTRPRISSDQAAEIDQILREYAGGIVIILYYHDGSILEIRQEIKKIDTINHLLVGSEMTLPLKDILAIKTA